MPENITKDIYTDKLYAYLIHEAIRTGHMSFRLALLEIGPVNNSRWLTTANRFLRIWCSKHGLRGQNYQKFMENVEYIMKVYLPCWFNKKIQHHWTKGPQHVLFQLEAIRSLKEETQKQLRDHIQRSGWYSHTESILHALLCSDQEEERRWAVNKIISLSETEEESLGNINPRSRRTPKLKFEAISVKDLVNWDTETVHEPPLTCHLSTAQLRHFYGFLVYSHSSCGKDS